MTKLHPGTAATQLLQTLANGSCLTVQELETTLSLTRRQLSDAASRLAYRKYLTRMARGCYMLSPAGLEAAAGGEIITSGPIGPLTTSVRKAVKDTFRGRVWRSIRMRRVFTLADVISDAEAGDADPAANASRYVGYLRRAGYVAELPARAEGTRMTSPGFKRYRLIRDTGPQAPVFQPKQNSVHDYNTGEDVPCPSR